MSCHLLQPACGRSQGEHQKTIFYNLTIKVALHHFAILCSLKASYFPPHVQCILKSVNSRRLGLLKTICEAAHHTYTCITLMFFNSNFVIALKKTLIDECRWYFRECVHLFLQNRLVFATPCARYTEDSGYLPLCPHAAQFLYQETNV